MNIYFLCVWIKGGRVCKVKRVICYITGNKRLPHSISTDLVLLKAPKGKEVCPFYSPNYLVQYRAHTKCSIIWGEITVLFCFFPHYEVRYAHCKKKKNLENNEKHAEEKISTYNPHSQKLSTLNIVGTFSLNLVYLAFSTCTQIHTHKAEYRYEAYFMHSKFYPQHIIKSCTMAPSTVKNIFVFFLSVIFAVGSGSPI